MANEIRVHAVLKDDVTKELGRIQQGFAGVQKSKGFQAVAEGVGIGAGIGAFSLLSSGISTAVGVISSSIDAASNLNEQINKTQVVFGSASGSVLEFAKNTALSLGISNREALEAAGNFGNMFTAMGLATDQSAAMSIKLVGLASDLASFNNIDPAEALDKLRSGLTGEAEPLRTVGVLLNESTVAAEAAALGFKAIHGQFTEGQKVQARYSLILKQTTSAQGDFARTSGSLANQQRELAAKIENVSAALGDKFIPIVIKAQQALLTAAPAADTFITALAAFPDTLLKGGWGWQAYAHNLEDAQKATDEERAALEKAGEEARTAQERAKDMAFGFTVAGTSIETSMKHASTYIGKVVSSLDKLTTTLSGYYDLASARGQEASLRKNLSDDEIALRNVRKEFSSGKIKAGEYHSEVDILTGKIADDKQALLDNALAQSKLGKNDDLTKWIADQKKNWDHLTAAEKKAVAEAEKYVYWKDLGAQAGRDTTQGHRGKAAGGPVFAGTAYTVGELGPETFVPAVSGTIIPNGGGGGSSWGGGVTVVYAPQFSTASASEAQRFMQAIAKPLTIEMNRQRLL